MLPRVPSTGSCGSVRRSKTDQKNQPMKTCIKNLFLLPVLMAGLGLTLAGRVTAQTFTTLYSFSATDPTTGTNSDGKAPLAGLLLSGNTLYGTAVVGGTSGSGTA